MKYFNNSMTLDEVKAQYRKMAMALHPDKGGDEEQMKQLNEEFDLAFKVAKRFSASETEKKESSTEFKMHFYTENGWVGSRYDSNLYCTDITKLVRDYVKYVHPTYKFSVTVKNCDDITISLMEYPVELTNVQRMKEYCKNHSRYWNVYIDGKYYSESEMTDELWTKFAEEQVVSCSKHEQLNHYYMDEITWINPTVLNVLKDVVGYLESYNYDDSDGQIDYFDCGFYVNLQIGKWNKDAKFVEKSARITPTKTVKGAKKICA